MRVFVTGPRGMLGHVVVRYLRECGHVVTEQVGRYDGNALELGDAEAVVNCAGVVDGRASGLYLANSVLPVHLAARLNGRRMVHPSTDCVFDGRRGWYAASEVPNATDPYGRSKAVGEACAEYDNVTVLRTSIVGPPGIAGRGLLGWFLSQSGSVDGWIDHMWNGITTLAWAELAEVAIRGGLESGLHQPTTTEVTSKYELLRLFGSVFGHPIEVRPVTTEGCDRTLIPTMTMPPIGDQLTRLRDWA